MMRDIGFGKFADDIYQEPGNVNENINEKDPYNDSVLLVK
jgi:hypothetical protein